jgi:TonB family protein
VKRRPVAFFAVFAVLPISAAEKKPPIPMPDSFVLGRHTFIDIGPPNDFYEIVSVHRDGAGTTVERITVTPPGDPCIQPATVEIGNAYLAASVSELLAEGNPCSIPEKALRRELKRCKKCLVFSGAEITMSAACGTQTRLIRMNILDRDMFDPAPNTPEHTSWTMALLARLYQALGPGVLEHPIFTLDGNRGQTPVYPQLADLQRGVFDALFKNAPDKPSELYVKAHNPPPAPTVSLVRISPVRPTSEALPPYPPLARLAKISGVVSFTFAVTADGSVNNFQVSSGHPLLRKAVEAEVLKWRFSVEAAGLSVEAVIRFSTNCSQ